MFTFKFPFSSLAPIQLVMFFSVLLTTYNCFSQKPLGASDFDQASYASSQNCDISIDSKGGVWIVQNEYNVLFIKKWVDGVWVPMSKFNSTNSFLFIEIKHDQFDNLWLVCQDRDNSKKATVMRLINSNLTVVGTRGFSAGQADDTHIAFDSAGTPWVTYMDYGNNKKVTVMKLVNGSWAAQGGAGFTGGEGWTPSIAIDKMGIPWVAFKDWTQSGKATVMKLVNNAWITQGTTGFSAGAAQNTDLVLDSLNRPLVAYQDGTNNSRLTVMKLVNGTWTLQGNAGFSHKTIENHTLIMDYNDVPWVIYETSVNVSVMKYTAGTWTIQGKEDISFYNAYSSDIALDHNGNPWIIYVDAALEQKASIMKFENDTWRLQGSAGVFDCASNESNMELDADGNPWVAYVDWIEDRIHVSKFIDGVWKEQGPGGIKTNNLLAQPILKFDQQYRPMVVFLYDSFLHVYKLENDSWSKHGNSAIVDFFPGFYAFKLAKSKDDVLWIAYADDKYAGSITVMKMENGTWSVQGGAGFSNSSVTHIDINVDDSGTPWVVYSISVGGYRGTVKKLVNGTWVTQGGAIATGTGGRALYTRIKFDKNDTAYVVFNLYLSLPDNQLTIKKLVNGVWIQVGKGEFATGSGSSGGYNDIGFDTLGNLWAMNQSNTNIIRLRKFENGVWKNKNKSPFSVSQALYGEFVINKKGKMFIKYEWGGVWVKEYKIPSKHQLEVFGNKLLIESGDTLKSVLDGTHFGFMGLQNSRTIQFNIKNTGYDTLKFSSTPRINISGANASEFQLLNNLPAFLKVGDSVWISIKHSPSSAGSKFAKVNVFSNDDANKTYSFGIGSEVVSCNESNPIANEKGFLYRASIAETDSNGLTCYCDSVGKLLLGLKIGNSGAVIPTQNVNLKLGNKTTFSSSSSGGMIGNPHGYIIIDRKWYVAPQIQPSIGNVAVRYYFTNSEFNDLQTAAASFTKPSTVNKVDDISVYITSFGAGFPDPHKINGTLLSNGQIASTTVWKKGNIGSDHYAEFNVSYITGGAAGVGANGGSRPGGLGIPAPEINLKGNSVNINKGDTFPSVSDSTDFGSYRTSIIRRSFVIENIGYKKLQLNGFNLTGVNAAEFTVSGLPDSVSAGASVKFYVTLNALGGGLKTAHITIKSWDVDESMYDFKVQAYQLIPEILVRGNFLPISDGDLTPSLLDSTNFGTITDTTRTRSFVIENLGTDTLFLSGITLNGPNASDFSIPIWPSRIMPQSSNKFHVRYAPPGAAVSKATVHIGSNDADESDYSFDITATKLITGIVELKTGLVSVYPNPTESSFNVLFKKDYQYAKLSIYSSEGKLVSENEMNGLASYSIDVREMQSGIYTLMIEVDGELQALLLMLE